MRKKLNIKRLFPVARRIARIGADVMALADGATVKEIETLIDDVEGLLADLLALRTHHESQEEEAPEG